MLTAYRTSVPYAQFDVKIDSVVFLRVRVKILTILPAIYTIYNIAAAQINAYFSCLRVRVKRRLFSRAI